LSSHDCSYAIDRTEKNADYLRATELIKKEKYGEALPYLKIALKKNPRHVFIKADYTVCLVWTGAKKEAVDFFLKHKKELQKLNYVSRNIARAFYDLGHYKEAKQLYERTLSANPYDNEAFKGVIYCLSQTRDYSRAHKQIEEARTKGIISPHTTKLLEADLFQKERNYKKAYMGFIELLRTSEDEDFLKDAQDKRKEIIPFLSVDEINLLLNSYRDNYPQYAIVLIDKGQTKDLAHISKLDIETLPPGILLDLAWGYFKAGNHAEALQIYDLIMLKWPDSCLARIGSAYPLSIMKQFDTAQQALEWVLKKDCFLLDALFAKAFVYEKQRKFLAAIDVYEEILAMKPKNSSAQKLKIRALSDLGAPSIAFDEAVNRKITEQTSMEYLKGDLALNRLRWDQTDEAITVLEEGLDANPANTRVRYDYIMALRNKNRMQDVIGQFHVINHNIESIPHFVIEAVADAYLYLEMPETALHYYKLASEKNPKLSFHTLMGLFSAFQELREWEEAEKTWEEIQAFMGKEKELSPWLRLEAFQAYGWYLTYQDKLKESQNYFTSYINQAGMNSGCRNALGYTYLWRGWPRRALEEFKIAQNVDIGTFDSTIQTGTAIALNEQNCKNEARNLAQKLYEKFPRNRHVQDLIETLNVEGMNEFWIEGKFIHESPGAEEFWIRSSMTEPVVPTFKLFQEIVWQETSYRGEDYDWNRSGLGSEWIVLPEVIWKQAVTFDYEDFDDFGYYTTITWLPTDYLKITAGYDSFRLDIPIRARAAGIEGESASLDLYYHESDLRFYGLTTSLNWLDDGIIGGNKNPSNRGSSITLYYDQNVLNFPDFKIRFGGEFNYSANSKSSEKNEVDYFSPLESYTFLLNQTFHYIHYARYDRKFRSGVYTREGLYAQHGYKSYGIYGITFEQTSDISKTLAFLWNVGWDNKIYDGDSTHVWSGFFGLRKNF